MQPIDGLVGHGLGEVERLAVLALLNADELLVLGDHRVVLTGLGSKEAPVVIEAPRVGPVVKRTGRALLALGRQVPLADRRRRIAVLLQDLRKRRRIPRQHRRIAREAPGELRDASHADRVMVAPREQRGPRRRAHRCDVEAVVAQPLLGHPVEVRSVDRPAERARVAEAGVVDQHDQHVRSSLRRLDVADQPPVRLRAVQRLIRDAAELRTSDRQLRTIIVSSLTSTLRPTRVSQLAVAARRLTGAPTPSDRARSKPSASSLANVRACSW